MAPRQTARRFLVAAPALALAAFAVTACSPPNEQPADPDAPYTLPTYTEPNGAETDETTTEATTTPDEADEVQPEGAEGEAGEGLDPGAELPMEGQQAPLEEQPAEQPAF